MAKIMLVDDAAFMRMMVKNALSKSGYDNFVEAQDGAEAVKKYDEENPDIYDALARRYLDIGCSVMTPNPNRLELLGRLIDEYQIDGVVEMTLQACHTYNVESLSIRRFVNEKKGIPYINVETDYSQADIGQLNTRIAAFIEML